MTALVAIVLGFVVYWQFLEAAVLVLCFPFFSSPPLDKAHVLLIACAPADMKGPSIHAHPQFTPYFLLPLYCDREDECPGGSLQVREHLCGVSSVHISVGPGTELKSPSLCSSALTC